MTKQGDQLQLRFNLQNSMVWWSIKISSVKIFCGHWNLLSMMIHEHDTIEVQRINYLLRIQLLLHISLLYVLDLDTSKYEIKGLWIWNGLSCCEKYRKIAAVFWLIFQSIHACFNSVAIYLAIKVAMTCKKIPL